MKSNVFICLVRNIDRLEIIDGKWFGGNSFQKYEFENIQETSQFEIGLKFRTTDGNGVLLFVGNAEKSLSLMMYNGVLELVLGTEKINDLTIVDDNQWHIIKIKYNRGDFSMIVDEGMNHYVSFF
jgi:hypothetical protein